MRNRTLLVSIWLFATAAAAEVQDSLEYRYYDAPASPGQSLMQSLNSATPIRENGRRFHGYTKWNIRWDFRWRESGDGLCKLVSANTRVTGIVTLPRLTGGDAGQQVAFDRYVLALTQHELGHYRIGRDAATQIDQDLLALPAMRDCASLEKTANDGAHRTLERFRNSERQYDVTTGHGSTQGARLDK
ncbi:MAG: DUF922 domain-containing protein [Betaproteobacteria bacterium]